MTSSDALAGSEAFLECNQKFVRALALKGQPIRESEIESHCYDICYTGLGAYWIGGSDLSCAEGCKKKGLKAEYCCSQGIHLVKNTLDKATFKKSSVAVIKAHKGNFLFEDWSNPPVKIKSGVSDKNIKTGFIQWSNKEKAKCGTTKWRLVVRVKTLTPKSRSEKIWEIVNAVLAWDAKQIRGKMEVPGAERSDSLIFQYCAEEGAGLSELVARFKSVLAPFEDDLDTNLPPFLSVDKYVGFADYEGIPSHSHGAILCDYTASFLAANFRDTGGSKTLLGFLKSKGYGEGGKVILPECYPQSDDEFLEKCRAGTICDSLKLFCR